MSVIPLYEQYGSGIRDLFSSAACIKILMLLLESGRPLPDICAGTGHVHAAVLAKVRQLEEYGLLTRTSETFALSTIGTVLAAKIQPLYAGPDAGADDDPSSASARSAPAEPEEGADSFDGPALLASFDIANHYERRVKEVNLVMRSGIRTRMLLELEDGMKDRGVLRAATGCKASHFRTNLRRLVDAGLLLEQTGGISLTPEGTIIAARLTEIIPVAALIIRHRGFWRDHELCNLPWFALDSLGALADSTIIHDEQQEFFRTYEHYLSLIASAHHIHGITGMANPGFAEAIGRRAVEGIPAEIIVTPSLARHLHDEPYRKKVRALSTFPHFGFRVTELPIPPCITVTDTGLSMKMYLRHTGIHDQANGFVSTAPEALTWAERVYEYYRRHSLLLKEYSKDSDQKE
ncbi:MAG TPA: DUF1724 domain-containing protein [Methanoculleus sp.]|nr:DUF1724 domain-containing protein [Methanoculleus sp.]